MKNLIIAILILTAIITVACLYSLFCTSTLDDLTEEISALSYTQDNAQHIDSISKRWKHNSFIYSFAVNENKLHNISILFSELSCALTFGDEEKFNSAKGRLLEHISHMREDETPNIEVIL